MASSGKLWFEMGVRDHVEEKLKKVVEELSKVDSALDKSKKAVKDTLDAFEQNAAKLEQVYYGLDKAISKVGDAMKHTSDAGELSRLKEMLSQLQNMRSAFEAIGASEGKMATKGSVAGEMVRQSYQLALRQVNEYTKGVVSSTSVEEKRVDSLRNKYNEIARVRDRLSASINNAGAGVDVSGATALVGKLWSLQMQISKALAGGRTMTFGADFKQLIHGANEAAKSLDNMTKAQQHSEAAALKANESLVRSFDKVTEAGRRQSRMLNELTMMMNNYISLYALKGLATDIITRGGQFEVQHVALQNIIGDLGEANRLFSQLQELAIESPMTFRQLAGYTKQLAAYSIPSDELYDTTKRLADLSTGLGVDMNRLILAYGQVRSAAVLRGQELRQFTEAGIPLVQRLAEKFTELNGKVVQTGDVFGLISKRQVPFEMVRDVLWDMTNEGGQFFNMQYHMAETLSGKWQKMSDAYEQFLGRLADGNSLIGGGLKLILTMVTDLIRSGETLLPIVGGISSAFIGKNAWNAASRLFTADASGLAATIRNAREQNAMLIQREAILGRINAEEKSRLLTSNAQLQNNLLDLMQAGRLNVTKLTGLYLAGKIKSEDLSRLVTEGAITAQEEAQILATTKLTFAKMQLSAAMKGVLSSTTLITAGLGLAIAAAFSFANHLREAREEHRLMAEEIASDAKERVRSSKSVLGMEAPTESGEYVDRIKAMTEYLKENAIGLRDVATESQHTGNDLESLKQRYEELREAILAVKDANEKMSEKANIISELDDKSGTNWWIGPNTELSGRLKEAQSKYQKFMDSIANLPKKAVEELTDAVSDLRVKFSDYDKAVKDAGAEKSLQRQLDIMRQFPKVWEALRKSSAPGEATDFGALGPFRLASEYAKAMNDAEMSWSNIEEQVKNLMRADYGTDIDFAHLTGSAKEFLSLMMKDLLEKGGATAEQVTDDWFKKMRGRSLDVNVRINTKDGKQELDGWKKELDDKLGHKYTTDIKAVSNISEVAELLWKKREELKKQLDSAKPIAIKFGLQFEGGLFTTAAALNGPGLAAAREFNEAKTVDNMIVKVLKDLGLALNKPSKSKSSGSKKDAALERAKTELEEVKKFYSEYKKYRKQYGDERGLNMVEDIFGMQRGEGKKIVSDYRKTLNDILKSIPLNTEARKKFGLSVRQLLGDIDIEELKESTDRALSELKEWMQKRGEQYNLFKSLLDKTGDIRLANTAFSDGRIFDEYANELVDKLRKKVPAGLSSIDWHMTDAAAQQFFGENKEAYELWKKIVTLTQKNYTDALNEVGNATQKMLTTEEKIRKAEGEISRLREKGAGDEDIRILAKEQELKKLRAQMLEESEPYLRFYSAILSMTADEAEQVGQTIKENLVRQLSDGTINADKYLKSLKNIEGQLSKMRGVRSALGDYAKGGVNGVLSSRRSRVDDNASAAAIRVEQVEKEILEARKALGRASREGNEQEINLYRGRLRLLNLEKQEAEGDLRKAERMQKTLKMEEEQIKNLNEFISVAEMAIGMVNGIADAIADIGETFEALGNQNAADVSSDISDGIKAAISPFSSAINSVKSLLSGDIGGAIGGIVGIFTNPIKGFAQLHDKRREREIQKSIQQVQALTTAYKNLESAIASALGGIYTAGGYEDMLANLKRQSEEARKQLEAEREKKKKDSGKLLDYEEQAKAAEEAVRNFARDMAKTLYSIDVQDWAKQLGDALFDAWKKGEDGAEAFKKRAKDILADVAKNIVVKKIIETALAPVMKTVEDEMTAKEGKLDEASIARIASALSALAGPVAESVGMMYDALDEATGDMGSWKDEEKTSSGANAIKSITEDQTNLLLSYINAMRADLSIHVERFRIFMEGIVPGLSNQFAMQLAELRAIEQNTHRSADGVERVYDLLDGIQRGVYKMAVKVYT